MCPSNYTRALWTVGHAIYQKIVTRTGTIQLIVPPEGELKTKENNSLKSMVSGAWKETPTCDSLHRFHDAL